MAAQAQTYSFLDVQCTMTGPGGAAVMGSGSGVAKEGITVEASEDIGHLDIGAGGEAMHSLHAGRPGRATIRLLKTSPVNAILSDLFNLQVASSAVYGKNTIVVSDTARGDIVTCLFAGFLRFTPINYGEDAGMNEWVFNVGRVSWNLGDGSVA